MTIVPENCDVSAIWITWEHQRRNRSMATKLGARLYEMGYAGSRLGRYLRLILRTLRVVFREQPDIVYFQNPSIVLASLMALLRGLRLIRARTIGDFHNAGVVPPRGRFLIPWIVRNTDLVIVSNRNLEPAITSVGGRVISIPDPLPTFMHATFGCQHATDPSDVLFVCSWAADEPIVEVLRAAQILEQLGSDIVISTTGRARLEAVGWHGDVPRNVRLLGYLSDTEFEDRLARSSVVLDLTTTADCMVCGAYEAVSACVPMIVSDNMPTREYFSKGALFTDNSAEDIARATLAAVTSRAELQKAITELKHELLERERILLRDLASYAANLVAGKEHRFTSS
jgi:hypothetical protein